MNNQLVINNVPLIANLTTYKNYVYSIPTLNEDEERELLLDFKVNGSLESAKALVISQLKTVLNIAKEYKNYGLPEEDLIQEGNIGLMKAVKNYNISHKVRLYTYSLVWIKSEIQNYIIKNWKIVKIGTTKNFKKLFFNYRKIQKELVDMGIDKKELSSIIQKRLLVSKEEVEHINQYFNNEEISISEIIKNDNDNRENNKYTYELIENDNPESITTIKIDTEVRNSIIKQSMDELKDREKEVLMKRFFSENKETHKEISTSLNISTERVRQIEKEALVKLKNILTKRFNIKEIF